MVDVGKREDRILDDMFRIMTERDQAKADLAAEKVAHRVTKKQLQEVTELALQ